MRKMQRGRTVVPAFIATVTFAGIVAVCAAVWLASDDSDYVVGTTLFVDGGMMLYPGFSTNG